MSDYLYPSTSSGSSFFLEPCFEYSQFIIRCYMTAKHIYIKNNNTNGDGGNSVFTKTKVEDFLWQRLGSRSIISIFLPCPHNWLADVIPLLTSPNCVVSVLFDILHNIDSKMQPRGPPGSMPGQQPGQYPPAAAGFMPPPPGAGMMYPPPHMQFPMPMQFPGNSCPQCSAINFFHSLPFTFVGPSSLSLFWSLSLPRCVPTRWSSYGHGLARPPSAHAAVSPPHVNARDAWTWPVTRLVS